MTRPKTGTIDPMPDGTFRVRLTVRGERKSLKERFRTYEDADEARAGALAVMAEELHDGVTLLEFGEQWLTRREVDREVRDPDTDWSRWNNHVKGTPLARMALPIIKRRHVAAWMHDLRRKGLARQTVINTLNVLRGVFRSALEEDLIRTLPTDEVRVPKQKRTADDWTYLTPPEQAKAVDVSAPDDRPIVKFAIWSGLRAGELACLRVADLGKDEAVVRFGTPPDLPTKAGKVRRIPILPGAREALDDWDVARRAQNGIVFPRLRGGFRDTNHIVRWENWTPVTDAIGRNVRWHDLRHTCAASLLRGWWGRRWSLEEVCAMLGHASITTTERYAHLADDILGDAARATSIGLESVRAAEAILKKTEVIPLGATLGNRTPDLRFTKSLAVLELPQRYDSLDQNLTDALRAIAGSEPRALVLAADALGAALEYVKSHRHGTGHGGAR